MLPFHIGEGSHKYSVPLHDDLGREGEERFEPNGFDKLLIAKKARLDRLKAILAKDPHISREDAAKALGVSLRTIARDFNSVGRKKWFNETEKSDVQYRLKRLKELLDKNPDMPRTKMALEIGVSAKTLNRYLRELGATFQDFSPALKTKRIQQLNEYWAKHPHATRKELREVAGISKRTLAEYITSGLVHP